MKSPIHTKIEADIIKMSLTEIQATRYRELVYDLINLARCTYEFASSKAMESVISESIFKHKHT